MAWMQIIMDVFMPSDKILNIGDVSEWLKEHAWKVCKGQPFESSNLSVTAI
jgi:hypothetical protein